MKTIYKLLVCLFVVPVFMTAGAELNVQTLITNDVVSPMGMAVDASGTYYISDTSQRIISYIPDNAVLASVAGVKNLPGTNNGPGLIAQFNSPRGVVPYAGGLLVADSGNHALRFVTNQTSRISYVTNFAGIAKTAGGLSEGLAEAVNFNYPTALATDGTNVFIADTKNNAVRMLYPTNITGVGPTNFVATISTDFNSPMGLTYDAANLRLFVSDSGNNCIKILQLDANYALVSSVVFAGTKGLSGTNDSYFATSARFSNPMGLAWITDDPNSTDPYLLVVDNGNNTLRKVVYDTELSAYFPGTWNVSTFAGIPGRSGYVDGVKSSAIFNSPTDIHDVSKDGTFILAVLDSGNNAVRLLQSSLPLAQLAAPSIGYVVTTMDQKTGKDVISLIPFDAITTLYNEVVVAIAGESVSGVKNFYTLDGSAPTRSANQAPDFVAGSTGSIPLTVFTPDIADEYNNVDIKAVSVALGRKPSPITECNIKFETKAPLVLGDNPAAFTLTCDTINADIYYLEQTGSSSAPADITTASGHKGPFRSGTVISMVISKDTTIWIQAKKAHYAISGIYTKIFRLDALQQNTIAFGFSSGEASTSFLAMPGQTYAVPVTLSLMNSAQKMYSLQFSMSASSVGAAPAATSFGFNSFLKYLKNNILYDIPPIMYDPSGNITIRGTRFDSLVVTNSTSISVGWLEVLGRTNLYDTTAQDLITYSYARDTLYNSQNQKVIVGSYSVQIPTNALSGQQYQIQIARPSATSDGVSQDANIVAPNGSLKTITLAPTDYVVGDVTPFRWFNAGDFGGDGVVTNADGTIKGASILNNDVVQVFETAVYQNSVPPQDSDFYDAMDACPDYISLSAIAADPSVINTITAGSGPNVPLAVNDVYVIFARSMDPSLSNVVRRWTYNPAHNPAAYRKSVQVQNLFRGQLAKPVAKKNPLQKSSLKASIAASPYRSEQPFVRIKLDDAIVKPGQRIVLPVHASIRGKYLLRNFMIRLDVQPIGNSPALDQPVKFNASSAFGTPTHTSQQSHGTYAGVWLSDDFDGAVGDAIIGSVDIQIPDAATANSAYRVSFGHFSASPNGLGLLPLETEPALITLKDAAGFTWDDSIPDSWRMRYFGSVSSPESSPYADPDGDGLNNLAEFKAGTDPLNKESSLRLTSDRTADATGTGMLIRWVSNLNKHYIIEARDTLEQSQWTSIGADIIGTGGVMEYVPSSNYHYYRVRLVE